jgi:hypothetical protein
MKKLDEIIGIPEDPTGRTLNSARKTTVSLEAGCRTA